jgi:hypothetical protein
LILEASFAPLLPGRQLGSAGLVKAPVPSDDFTCPRGAVTDRLEINRRQAFKI